MEDETVPIGILAPPPPAPKPDAAAEADICCDDETILLPPNEFCTCAEELTTFFAINLVSIPTSLRYLLVPSVMTSVVNPVIVELTFDICVVSSLSVAKSSVRYDCRFASVAFLVVPPSTTGKIVASLSEPDVNSTSSDILILSAIP